MWLTTRYATRPLHLFGGGGLLLFTAGLGILSYISILCLYGLGPVGDRPLLILGVLLVLFGGQMISVGLLAEVVLRQTIGERCKYSIAERTGGVTLENITQELPVR